MISVRNVDNITLVRPEIHRLDEMLGRELVAFLREYIQPKATIVLNLADVIYLNSVAIGYVTTCCRRLNHRGGRLAVCCLQESPRKVFKIMRLEQILAGIFETEEDALEALREPVRS